MNRRPWTRRLPVVGLGLLGFLVAFGIWWAFVAIFQPRSIILPSPAEVLDSLTALWTSGSLIRDIGASLREFVAGFSAGVVTGIIAGAAMARSRVVNRILTPPVEIFRVIIPFSLVPLTVVWFGISPFGKMFVVWYATLFVVVVNTLNGMRNVDPQLLKVGRMLGYSPRVLVWRVTLPAALPRILAGIQLAVAFGWVSVIAAEYIGSSAGLGYLITTAQQSLATNTVIAAMVVIGIIGAVLSGLVSVLERILVPYRENAGW